MKKCSKCGKENLLSEFFKDASRKDGFSYWCKECDSKRIGKHQRKQYLKNPLKFILNNAKYRAKKKGIPFDLSEDDLEIPEVCPVFKKPFIYGCGLNEFSISIDRIDNSKGYVKENVIIVSYKANTMKSNATIVELNLLTNFYNSLGEK